MATNLVLLTQGTPIVWADDTDYPGGSQVGGTRTHDLDLTGMLFGVARQGIVADLGASRSLEYSISLAVEFKTGEAPESGETADLYWGPAVSASAGFQGGLVGTEGAYIGTAGDSLADSLLQLMFIGSISLTADAVGVVQRDTWIFSPPTQFGQPVIVNSTDAEDFNLADAEEMYVRMVPLNPDIQAAA